jgi:hypothetical protein
MSIYRYSRQLPNGWNVRLDLLPYNETLSGTVVEQPPYGIITIGEHASEFDDLPFGLQKPQTLKIELDWEGLSSDVRTLLSTARGTNPFGNAARNTWLLFSDRGTNSATWTLEFAGVEDNVDALDLEPTETGYTYNAELVDVAYYNLKTMTGYNVFFGYEPGDTIPYDEVFDSLETGGVNPKDNQTTIIPRLVNMSGAKQGGPGYFYAYASSFEHVMRFFRKSCGNYFNLIDGRASAWASLQGVNFDVGDDLRTLIETAATFYEQSTTAPRSAGSALTASTAKLVTHISETIESSAAYTDILGGMVSRGDKLSIGREDISAWDILKRLAETMGVKLSYSFGYDNTTYTSPTRPFITVKWNVRRIASPITNGNTSSTPDYNVSLTNALSRPSISVRGNNVLKGEARIEGFSEDDVTEWARIKSGTEASRSINVEPLLHNLPTYKDKAVSGIGWLRNGLLQTNIVVTRYGTTEKLLKAHETTRVFWGPSGTDYFEVSTPASAELPQITNPALYKLTLAERQIRSCLPYALVVFYSKVFAEEDSASIELDFDIRNSVAHLPQSLGAIVSFTGGAADTFTSLPWTKAICTSIVTNWLEGTATAKYYLFENP